VQATLLGRFFQLFAEVAAANGCSGRSSQFWIVRQNVPAEEAQSKLKLYAIRSVKRNVHRDLLFKKDCRYEFITQLWGNFWASHGAAR
jgi:hypothetical protein